MHQVKPPLPFAVQDALPIPRIGEAYRGRTIRCRLEVSTRRASPRRGEKRLVCRLRRCRRLRSERP